MKSIKWMMLSLIMVSGSVVFAQNETNADRETLDPVEVYYFHFTRRCATCQAVEDETQEAMKNLYPELMEQGELVFQAINLDEESSEPIAGKLGVEGQTLLIVRGDEKTDLTTDAFMYARSKPEKLEAELKEAIDALL